MRAYQVGEKVRWQWDQGSAEGRVKKVYRQKITRKGSENCPAYFIGQTDGDGEILKLHSERIRHG